LAAWSIVSTRFLTYSFTTNCFSLSLLNSKASSKKMWAVNAVTLKTNVHMSVQRESISIIVQQDVTMYTCLYFCKLLYMFRVVTPPIIRNS
jgi:hypothetical protein